MRKKQILTAVLCLVLVSLSLSCSRKKPADVTPGGTPIKGRITMLVGDITTLVTSYDYKDNSFTRRLVDETGVWVDIIAVSNADFPDKFNVMISSGDYPDVLNTANRNFTRNDLDYFGRQQKIFQELDQYDLYSYPLIKQMLTDHAAITSKLKAADGKFYALADVNDCLHCTHANGRGYYFMPFLRDSPWKGEPPRTLEDFAEYLRYIKKNDVNGNGDPNDEIPMVTDKNYIRTMIAYFAKAFMPWVKYGTSDGMAVRNGQIWEQYRENEFRESLKYLAGLYKEGLIAENSFTMTTDEMQALGETVDPSYAVGLVDWQGELGKGNGSARFPYWFHLYPLKGPTGQEWGFNGDPTGILNAEYVITNKATGDKPKWALEIYNAMMEFDNMLWGYSGEKGTFYGDPDSGEKSLGGGTPRFKLLIPFASQPVNTSWDQRNCMNRTLEFRLSEQASDVDTVYRWFETGEESLYPKMIENKAYNELQWIYFTANRSVPWAIPNEMFIPPMAMSEDDGNRISDIMALIHPYKEKAWSEFVVGQRNINSDADWNTYLSELERQGSKDLVSIYNKYLSQQ
jgi:putative aldouronate transport system substrate-binding protein